jgi:2-oxoglutarate ferredoxin oxidoreductase subunit delta
MTEKIKKKGLVGIKTNWCKGCGICVYLCPRKVLALDEMGKAVVVNPDKCTACKICEIHCPDFSIEVEEVLANAN